MWHQVAQRCKCQKQFGEAQGLLGDEKVKGVQGRERGSRRKMKGAAVSDEDFDSVKRK